MFDDNLHDLCKFNFCAPSLKLISQGEDLRWQELHETSKGINYITLHWPIYNNKIMGFDKFTIKWKYT